MLCAHEVWQDVLCDGVAPTLLSLPEYPSPYRAFSVAPQAPLLQALTRAPLLRIPVPSDARTRIPAFAALQTRVTVTTDSQPPHIDHPHRAGDPRRYNLFWAEAPRTRAWTGFVAASMAPQAAALLTEAVRANRDAAAVAAPSLQRYRVDPLLVSRYRIPAQAVAALEALLHHGEVEGWQALSCYGQTTLLTRMLSNRPFTTALVAEVVAALRRAQPSAVYEEAWEEPCVVVADDTAGLHWRYGVGESGASFYRVWLSTPAAAAEGPSFAWGAPA